MALLGLPEAFDGGSGQGRRRASEWSSGGSSTKLAALLALLGFWFRYAVLLALLHLLP